MNPQRELFQAELEQIASGLKAEYVNLLVKSKH